jgi:hypothetical protein
MTPKNTRKNLPHRPHAGVETSSAHTFETHPFSLQQTCLGFPSVKKIGSLVKIWRAQIPFVE